MYNEPELQIPAWKESKKGNYYIQVDNVMVIAAYIHDGDQWQLTIKLDDKFDRLQDAQGIGEGLVQTLFSDGWGPR